MINNQALWEGPEPHPDGVLTVLAVDPGGTSGYVWCTIPHQDLVAFGVSTNLFSLLKREKRIGYGEWAAAPVKGIEIDSVYGMESQVVSRLHTGCHRLRELAEQPLTHVVIEDFVIRLMTKDRNLLAPVRITAAFYDRLHEDEDLDVSLHLQSPSDAMSTVSDSQLRLLDLWWPGKQHARDATRHLVLFLRKYVAALR